MLSATDNKIDQGSGGTDRAGTFNRRGGGTRFAAGDQHVRELHLGAGVGLSGGQG